MDDGQQMDIDRPKQSKEKKLRGINGWLTLFQIYIVLSLGSAIACTMHYFYLGKNFDIIITLAIVAFLIALLLCVIQFYRLKMTFRIFYITFVVVSIIILAIYLIRDPIDILSRTGIIIGIVVEVLVIGALFTSERVKNTFS